MSIGNLVQELTEAGVHPALAIDVVTRAFAAGCQSVQNTSMRTSRQERNHRYYEKNKERLKASETSELRRIKTVSDGAGKCPPDPLKDNINIPPSYPTDTQAPRGVIVPLPRKENRKSAKASKAPAYSGDFEIFWAEYPRQKNTSKSEAFDVFDRLTADDQTAAIDGAIAYAASCRKDDTPDRFIAHATTFLRQRRWECAA